ncbi:hypothetical protein DL98DRAFT_637760 [Cadophora sp. DSE1049]|nr:hypothetical protein DL98DRAFT_637760 [Cadophora sp. DSE1049]
MSDDEGFAVVISKRSKYKRKPFRFLDLPRELRDEVYRQCFSRQIGIAPGFNYGRRKIPVKKRVKDGAAWEKYTVYKCQWDGRRKFLPIPKTDYDTMTPVHGKVESMTVHWTTTPTPAQSLLLSQGMYDLPDTEGNPAEGIYEKIEHRASQRHDGTIEIINTQKQLVAGLIGIGLLGTSQQVYNEAIKFLYGNTFVINTAFVHDSWSLRLDSYPYPGLPNRNSTPLAAAESTRRVKRLLRKGDQPKFSKYDLLLRFLRTIGPYCASLIRSIKINGEFKTEIDRAPLSVDDLQRFCHKLPFADILKVYTPILNEVCVNLTTLTLDHSWGVPWSELYKQEAIRKIIPVPWTWVVEDSRSDDERISEIVEGVVKGLPSLQRLQLGDLVDPARNPGDGEDMYEEQWGIAVKWSQVVRDQESERALEEKNKREAGEKADKKPIHDRLFQLRPTHVPTHDSHEEQEKPIESQQDQTHQGGTSSNSTRSGRTSTRQQFQVLKASQNTRKKDTTESGKTEQKGKGQKTNIPPPPKTASKSLNLFALLLDGDEDEQDD